MSALLFIRALRQLFDISFGISFGSSTYELDEETWFDLSDKGRQNLLEIAEALIRAGADLSAKNNECNRAGNSPVVKALKNLKPMLFNSHFNQFPFSLMKATKKKEKVRIKKNYLGYSKHCLI
jgi:hypothetical protein